MKVSNFELFNALLFSTDKTENIKQLMNWLRDNMKSNQDIVITLEKEE